MKVIAIVIIAATLALGAWGASVAVHSIQHAVAIHERSVA